MKFAKIIFFQKTKIKYLILFLVVITIKNSSITKNAKFKLSSNKFMQNNTEISTNLNESTKLKKIIEDQTQQINNLKDTVQFLKSQVNILNSSISTSSSSSNSPQISSNPDTLTYMKQLIDNQNFYKQIEMQIVREKELRESVDIKLKQVDETERKIEKIYNELNYGLKNNINQLTQESQSNKKLLFEINQRLFILETEKAKEQVSRNLLKNGLSQSTSINQVEPGCLSRGTCRVCLEDPQCVWCSIEKKCKLGDMSGPYDGSCLNSFEYSTCSNSSCFKLSTCSECIANENCGWCGIMKKCVDGTPVAPLSLCSSNYIHSGNSKRCKIN
jgi:hypothetical protein